MQLCSLNMPSRCGHGTLYLRIIIIIIIIIITRIIIIIIIIINYVF